MIGVAAATTAATFLVLAILVYFMLRQAQPPGCEERKTLARATSSDGAWAATVYENVCSDGGFVTIASNTVEITPPNQKTSPFPSDDTMVFGTGGDPVQGPMALRWTGPKNLEITLPNDAWIGRQKSSFADLTISYKYVPDDPAERACLKQWRSLPSDEEVRRSLSPTENIRVFLAKCRAEGGSR